ncbi:RNA polymerase sigma factor [Lysobacter korlensis]|uniref:RNA polymerase sigma factor n=1 Tax=Lysobacter korlensis TaxID=553636 RepID=A0ABV6RTI9_9GAMM
MTSDLERRRAFDDFVREVADPVRRFLRRRTDADTADDVLSDTMLVCWRRFDDLPAAGERLPWAYVAARNCLRNAERSARRRSRLTARIVALDPPASSVPPADADAADAVEVHAALAALRHSDAEVLRLWAWEELTAEQIGRVLGVSENAAAIRLHRAKRRLRDRLERNEGGLGHISSEEGARR